MHQNEQQGDVLELELLIRRPPESVKAWWTDLPEDYLAIDPTEQPLVLGDALQSVPEGADLYVLASVLIHFRMTKLN